MAKEILIGDSDKATQKEFQKILGAADYHLLFSESGEDVLLRAKLFKPDLIIAGTALSEKNGYQLCETIKNDREFQSIPFILLLNKSEKMSDRDRDRLKPDGLISKPLNESEVLPLVDRLCEATTPQAGRPSGNKMVLETFADMGEERFASPPSGWTEEEEIIDLVDVVEEVAEEAESKMSIDDFVVPEKAEPFGEMPSLETWGKLGEEEKEPEEEGLVLSVEGKEEESKEAPVQLRKEAPPPAESSEEDLFEKIELEDILEKVGKIELPAEREKPPAEGLKALKEELPPIQEGKEEPFAFEEFEVALKKGVEAETSRQEPFPEETLQPFSFEEIGEKSGTQGVSLEIPIEEKVEVAEEAFPKGLLEDMLKEEELKEVKIEGEGIEEEEELQEEGLEEEELREEVVQEEEFVEEKLQEERPLGEELKAEELFEEEELLEEEGVLEEELLRVGKPLEEETLQVVRELHDEEREELFQGIEARDDTEEREGGLPSGAVAKAARAEAVEGRRLFETAETPLTKGAGHPAEEIIGEKVQVMMEEFVRKHVPEMTKDIVRLTIERIEKMVREIVPDIAEKMIEEEIKRLEKGEPKQGDKG